MNDKEELIHKIQNNKYYILKLEERVKQLEMTDKKEKLEEFTKGMERILDEKTEELGDSWKTSTLGELREELHKQAKSLSVLISGKIDWDRERAKRILTHVANFAYLIYNRL